MAVGTRGFGGVTGFMEWRIKQKMPKKGILEGDTDFISELRAKEA